AWMQASTQLRNSSPKPARRRSYQAYASSMSCSASGARMSSAAMVAADPPLDLVPGQPGSRVAHQVGLAPGQLLLLPVVDRNLGRSRCQIVPEILHQLEFLRRAQVEHGSDIHIHENPSWGPGISARPASASPETPRSTASRRAS